MIVADVMSYRPVVIESFDSVEAAAQLMRARVIGALAVVEHGKLVGIVTDRDLVLRAVAVGERPWDALVRMVMTPKPATCSPDEPIEAAIERMMGHCVRRLIVVDGERVAGMISIDDLVQTPAAQTLAIKLLRRLAQIRGIELDGTFEAVQP
jgi:signal-transduction protein with cAMP-binding, CBS, and nucleotidyltransferase domain